MRPLNKYRYMRVAAFAAIFVLATTCFMSAGSGPSPIAYQYNRPDTTLVDTTHNIIVDSLGTLATVMEKLRMLREGGQGTVSILHLGDSHIQADFLTATVRTLFQRDFGNAGRGLIVPHKIVGTNGAHDYTITSPDKWEPHKCTENTPYTHGATGMAIESSQSSAELTISSQDKFCVVQALHSQQAALLKQPEELSIGSNCTVQDTPTSTRIVLSEEVDAVTLRAEPTQEYPQLKYYGFSLENGRSGVLYHSVGANGAAFGTYVYNPGIINGLCDLAPNMVIVSLGTNDCYGRNFIAENVATQLDTLVELLRGLSVPILLVTPMESGIRRRVRGRTSYSTNENLKQVANIITSYANDKGLAYWDMYQATGGDGANARWYKASLLSSDHIHCTAAGYTLQGEMLYGAIINYFNHKL